MRAVYVKLGQGVVLWSNILFDLITKFKKYIQEEVQGLRKPWGHILMYARQTLYVAPNSNEQSIAGGIYFPNCLLLNYKLLHKAQGNKVTISVPQWLSHARV